MDILMAHEYDEITADSMLDSSSGWTIANLYQKQGAVWLPWQSPVGYGGLRHIFFDHVIAKKDFQNAYNHAMPEAIARFILDTITNIAPLGPPLAGTDPRFDVYKYPVPNKPNLIVVIDRYLNHIHSAYPEGM